MTITNKLFGWSLFLILAIPGLLQAQDKSPQDVENSCRKSMQGFYNQLVGKGAKTPHAVLSRELRQLLKDDEDNMMDENGLIQGLDWDPIANGQDICERYEAGKVTRKGDRYLVEITCLWGNKKIADKKMRHEVMFSRGRWTIMNIHYYRSDEKGKPRSDSDLLSILKASREERRKTSK